MINRMISSIARFARGVDAAWAFADELQTNARLDNTLGVRSAVAGLWNGYRG